MNLIVDIGNSRIKTALFEKENIRYSATTERADFIGHLTEIHRQFPNTTDALLCHVGKIDEDSTAFLEKNFRVLPFDSSTKLPFTNLYETPKTLGLDRIGLVAAAQLNFPKKNCLIIDAGTCVTYDFINTQNEYCGGGISPGVQMRLKALHQFTENLPLLTPEKKPAFIGKNTNSAIQSGTIIATALEIDGFIDLYADKFKNLTVILTGGDHLLLSNHIKNSIFASSNFLLEGLNFILEYNKTQ